VFENARPQIEINLQADLRGKLALHKRQAASKEAHAGPRQGQHHDQVDVVEQDSLIDQLAVYERVDDADGRIKHYQEQEKHQDARIRAHKPGRPLHCSGGQFVF